jgi:hypothetical protein
MVRLMYLKMSMQRMIPNNMLHDLSQIKLLLVTSHQMFPLLTDCHHC